MLIVKFRDFKSFLHITSNDYCIFMNLKDARVNTPETFEIYVNQNTLMKKIKI